MGKTDKGALLKQFPKLDRQAIIDDISTLLKEEVSKKRGLKGAIIKRTFNRAIQDKPNIDKRAIDFLLNDLVTSLDPFYTDFEMGNMNSFQDYCGAHNKTITERILQVVDNKVLDRKSKTVRTLFKLLRPHADTELTSILPSLGLIVDEQLKLSEIE